MEDCRYMSGSNQIIVKRVSKYKLCERKVGKISTNKKPWRKWVKLFGKKRRMLYWSKNINENENITLKFEE